MVTPLLLDSWCDTLSNLFSKETLQDSTQNISEIPNGISSPHQKKSQPPSSPPKSGADLVQALPIEEEEGNLLGWFPTYLKFFLI